MKIITKFNQTDCYKKYGLSRDDVVILIELPETSEHQVKYPTVLIVPGSDEFPIESFEFHTDSEARNFVENLMENK